MTDFVQSLLGHDYRIEKICEFCKRSLVDATIFPMHCVNGTDQDHEICDIDKYDIRGIWVGIAGVNRWEENEHISRMPMAYVQHVKIAGEKGKRKLFRSQRKDFVINCQID
jgi:hypothetical protein